MEEKSNNRLKFYADTPAGQKNKLFVFKVSGLQHALDLAAKFIQKKGFIIRAAYYENPLKKSIRIDKAFDLKTMQNSIEEKKKTNNILSKIYG